MKRIAALLALVCLLTGALGASAFAAGPKYYKIGYCVNLKDRTLSDRFLEAFETYFLSLTTAEERFELFPLDAEGSAEKQREQVDFMLEQGMDALIVQPVDLAQVEELVFTVAEKKVPLVLVSEKPLSYNTRKATINEKDQRITAYENVCFVTADPKQAGMRQGQLISSLPHAGDLNGDGTMSFALIEGEDRAAETQIRSLYSAQLLSMAVQHSKCLYTEAAGAGRGNSKEICQNVLKRYKTNVDLILCNNDQLALGALAAIQEAGRVVGEDIFIIGADGDPQVIDLVRQGKISGTVAVNGQAMAQAAADAAVGMLHGEPQDSFLLVDYILVNQDNVNDL